MTDLAPERADGSRLRVAVVGAGVSGIVTACTLASAGFEVTVFERADDVGGVWSASRRYPGIATQDDRRSYAFSAAPMPPEADEHPTGEQVRHYLVDYLAEHRLQSRVRLATEVLQADLTDQGWSVQSAGPLGTVVEQFDWLVAANGVFSTPHVPVWPGRQAFEAAGGRVVSPGVIGDGADLDGRRTVVVGWGKTACDIAAGAARRSLSTAVVARTLTWKYPKRIGLGGLTFRHLVLTRAGERLLATRYRSDTGRVLLRRVPERLPRVLLGRAIARAIDRTTGLSGLGLLPTAEVRTSNSLVTEGFFEAVREGRLRVHRERSVAALGADSTGPWVELSDGTRLPADMVVAATGYEQGVPFLSESVRARIRSQDGALLLHRRVLAVEVPRLAFVGWGHSYRSPLTSEIAAAWLAGAMLGRIRLPGAAAQHRTASHLPLTATLGAGARTASLPGVTTRDLDQLLRDLGTSLPRRVRLAQLWRPLDPADYAIALQRVRSGTPELLDRGGRRAWGRGVPE